MAWLNLQKAAYALETLTAIPGVSRKFGGPVFNEFVLEFPTDWNRIKQKLEEKAILGGLALGEAYQGLEKCALVTITEKHSREKIDRYAQVLREVLK